jgi:predicted DNA-binding transcriptional regulator AlpA
MDFVIMKLLAIADLCDRWSYSKAGIHKLIRTEKFPRPISLVSRGKVRIFTEEDIETYEKGKPWLFDQEIKRRRQNLFLLLSDLKK